MAKIISGNLEDKGSNKKGWFIGHFMNSNSVFKTDNFEVKWAVCPSGWKKKNVARQITSKTMCILVKGKFLFKFPKEQKDIVLSSAGDFVFFDYDVAYTSTALQDSVLLVIRWPSTADDQIIVSN